ncbi:hypothetical protein UlMin_035604 [Ulmus minor]
MEVLVGPTYGIDVSSPNQAYVRDRGAVSAQDKHAAAVASSCFFLKENGGGICASGKPSPPADSSSSSSIGAPDDDEDDVSSKGEGDEEEVQSKLCGGALGDLVSLEESLPIKRGLSNYFSGRSKSFANLSEVSSVKDLGKRESPFNKRRRVLMASKLSRRSSFYSWANPLSMPLLTLNEDEEQQVPSSSEDKKQEHQEEEEEVEFQSKQGLPKLLEGRKLKSFKSRSCFSLADLQEEEEHR